MNLNVNLQLLDFQKLIFHATEFPKIRQRTTLHYTACKACPHDSTKRFTMDKAQKDCLVPVIGEANDKEA